MQHGDTYIEELRLRAPKSAKQSGIIATDTSGKVRPDMDRMAMVLDSQARGFEAKLRIALRVQERTQKAQG